VSKRDAARNAVAATALSGILRPAVELMAIECGFDECLDESGRWPARSNRGRRPGRGSHTAMKLACASVRARVRCSRDRSR
jgi:hypothetical protein